MVDKERRICDNRTAFLLARDLLLEGECVQICVRGQSMLPFFLSGSTILLHPIGNSPLRRGDVVLAETKQGNFVVHRIYRIEGERITLLGDGNMIGVEQMKRDKIYGRVHISWLHRQMGLLWQWLRPLRRYPLALLRRILPK